MTSLSSQNRTLSPIAGLFASSSRETVLRVFLLDPHRVYYQRQLESVTGLPIRAIQRELERLSAVGLLYRRDEGNRTYYQVDFDFPCYPELRGMILKTAGPLEAFRAELAVHFGVRLAFLSRFEDRALVVGRPGLTSASENLPKLVPVQWISSEAFLDGLENPESDWTEFLSEGTDLLGRRGDPIWRRIESAGYQVKKGKGVP